MKTCRVWLACALLGGCAWNSHTNKALKTNGDPPPESRASFDVQNRAGGDPRTLVLLALSGGGSRAAYFSAAVMLELEKAQVLQEVDAISSVSGGSLAAAYYCTSRDADDPSDVAPRVWSGDDVRELMSRNYINRWIGNQFWPHNVVRYWFTAWDRSDIMAQTFADNLFDRPLSGIDLELADLSDRRPYLILNATNATRNPLSRTDGGASDAPRQYGSVFTFTREDFIDLLGSDINDYSVGRAVMASATFPALFQDMTLRDFRTGRERYMHVFDGGNSDNLGLVSIKRLISLAESWPPDRRPDRYVVICVDAYTEPLGVDPDDADPRSPMDRLVDSNFMDSIDALLTVSRGGVLSQFESDRAALERLRQQQLATAPEPAGKRAAEGTEPGDIDTWVEAQQLTVPAPSPIVSPDATYADTAEDEDEAGDEVPEADVAAAGASGRDLPPAAGLDSNWRPKDLGDRLIFCHIEFALLSDSKLRRDVNRIPTDFRLQKKEAQALDDAAAALVWNDVASVQLVRAALAVPHAP